MANVLLKKEYPEQYTSSVSTRVSNALLVGEVIGMLAIGLVLPYKLRACKNMLMKAWHSLTCDYLGRKWAIVITTVMIVVGGILATASNGQTINGMFWMMTVARGTIGFGLSTTPLFHTSNIL